MKKKIFRRIGVGVELQILQLANCWKTKDAQKSNGELEGCLCSINI